MSACECVYVSVGVCIKQPKIWLLGLGLISTQRKMYAVHLMATYEIFTHLGSIQNDKHLFQCCLMGSYNNHTWNNAGYCSVYPCIYCYCCLKEV